jgi:hypothetical protein
LVFKKQKWNPSNEDILHNRSEVTYLKGEFFINNIYQLATNNYYFQPLEERKMK